MIVLIYAPEFHSAILSGRKTSTIRPPGRCKPGDELSHRKWDGVPYRKGVRQVELRSAVCTHVTPICLSLDGADDLVAVLRPGEEDEQRLGPGTMLALAIQEGFDNAAHMRDWFVKNAKLKPGVVIEAEQIQW
mgnify:CR=1 FL=1